MSRNKGESEDDYEPMYVGEKNFQSLENLARACDRFQISNGAGAFIVNANLKDLGLLTKERIVDRKKTWQTKK